MNAPGSFFWLARHEGRLAWRDMFYLMTAGGRWRFRTVLFTFLSAIALFHLIAYAIVTGHADVTAASGAATLVAITGSLVLSFFLMLSQALEQVTRLFYARGDLELLLEQLGLFGFVALVIFRGALRGLAGQAMIIQSRLTDRNHFWMFGQFPQRRADIVRRFMGVGRMPPGHGKDTGEAFGQVNRPLAAFKIRPDTHHG